MLPSASPPSPAAALAPPAQLTGAALWRKRALHAALGRHRGDGQVVAAAARAVATIFSNGGPPEARALARELGTAELLEAVLAENGGAAGQGEVAESLRAAARKVRLGAQAALQARARLH